MEHRTGLNHLALTLTLTNPNPNPNPHPIPNRNPNLDPDPYQARQQLHARRVFYSSAVRALRCWRDQARQLQPAPYP